MHLTYQFVNEATPNDIWKLNKITHHLDFVFLNQYMNYVAGYFRPITKYTTEETFGNHQKTLCQYYYIYIYIASGKWTS